MGLHLVKTETSDALNINTYKKDGFVKVADVEHSNNKSTAQYNIWKLTNQNEDVLYEGHGSWVYMIVDGDAISSLKVYEKMTEDDEIRKYIRQNYVAYAYYNQYLCNMLNNRFNVAKQNLNNFISFLNDNELNYYSSGKFRLKKNGEFFDWSAYEGEEFIENGHSFKILNDDDIVIELFNVDGVMDYNMWDRKNRLFETLSNNDLRYTIDQISINLKIPKKIISYLAYTISYRSVFDDLFRKSIQ